MGCKMPNKNKIRGNILETEVVDAFNSHHFEAERAWGSNGRALGYHEEVDVVVRDLGLTVQCKRRKALADYLICEHSDIVCVRRDGRGHKRLYVIPEDILFRLLEGKCSN